MKLPVTHLIQVVSGLYSYLLKQNCAPMSLDQMCLNMIISQYNEYDFKTQVTHASKSACGFLLMYLHFVGTI